MQERRFRPGDVLDDYCPHERRITDHAVVAMIDDDVKRTRCVVCDAEHEYKAAKVPVRKKPAPVGLFTQVLDGLQGPPARPVAPPSQPDPVSAPPSAAAASAAPRTSPIIQPPLAAAAPPASEAEPREDGPVRRPLIRAQFPKFDGQPAIPRAMPEFTIQSLQSRGGRPGGNGQRAAGQGHGHGPFRGGRRRPGGGAPDANVGPMRFGRDQGNGQPDGSGRPHGHGRRRRGKKPS